MGAAVVGAAAVAAGLGEHRVTAQRLVDDVVREGAGVIRAEQPQRGVRGRRPGSAAPRGTGLRRVRPRRVRPRWVARSRGPGAGRRGACSVKSCQAGMIRAGLAPRSAMSAHATFSASPPRASRRACSRGWGTATITGWSRARPSRMNGTISVHELGVPAVQPAFVPVRAVRPGGPAGQRGHRRRARGPGPGTSARAEPATGPMAGTGDRCRTDPGIGADQGQSALLPAFGGERAGGDHHLLDERHRRVRQVVVGGGVCQHLIQHGLIGGPGEHPVAAGMQLGADEPFHRSPPTGCSGHRALLPPDTRPAKGGGLSPGFWGDNEQSPPMVGGVGTHLHPRTPVPHAPPREALGGSTHQPAQPRMVLRHAALRSDERRCVPALRRWPPLRGGDFG